MADTFISLIRMAAAGARGEAVQEEACKLAGTHKFGK